jgi:hypothetical protein
VKNRVKIWKEYKMSSNHGDIYRMVGMKFAIFIKKSDFLDPNGKNG